jgi:DnaK suppressor protein
MNAPVKVKEVSAYRPLEDEPFMSERQLKYFRQKLLDWKEDILRESRETLSHLADRNREPPRHHRPRIV